MRTPAEYEAEIAGLRAQLDVLRQAGAAALGTRLSMVVGDSLNVRGVEEMVLSVTPDDAIGYLNAPMARLLGITDRRASIGQPVTRWDDGPLGPGLLLTLIGVARGGGEAHVVERTVPGIDPARLPSSAPRPAGDVVLRFCATARPDFVQLVVQDVTRLRWLEKTFSRYVSAQVIERMQALGDDLLQMRREQVTVLFGDLRGFSRVSQHLEPEQVQEMLNSYFTVMVACVEAIDGTVADFDGDGIMAIFGAPMPAPDHALRGLLCAVAMRRRHAEWQTARAAAGLPAPPLGLGLTCGPVAVGNLGTATRMQYTALGHTTNLAARLCGAAGGGQVLITADLAAAAQAAAASWPTPLPALEMSALGRTHFKNVDDPVEVLEVLDRG